MNRGSIYCKKILRAVVIIFITISCIYFFSMFAVQFFNGLQRKKNAFDPDKYRYQNELQESPISSPDHKNKLHMRVVYNIRFGGSGVLYGSLTSETDKEQIIFIKNCHFIVSGSSDKIEFTHDGEPSFQWKNNEVVIIDGTEIQVSENAVWINGEKEEN